LSFKDCPYQAKKKKVVKLTFRTATRD